MDKCLDCKFNRKLSYCCGSHPETRESVQLTLSSGRTVTACPNLDEDGSCRVYDTSNYPRACERYLCPTLQRVDLFVLLGYDKL